MENNREIESVTTLYDKLSPEIDKYPEDRKKKTQDFSNYVFVTVNFEANYEGSSNNYEEEVNYLDYLESFSSLRLDMDICLAPDLLQFSHVTLPLLSFLHLCRSIHRRLHSIKNLLQIIHLSFFLMDLNVLVVKEREYHPLLSVEKYLLLYN
jgi:hypothetical protein